MTGREKIESAFTPGGAGEIAAVICYEGIYHRDHWQQLTGAPWWHSQSPDVDVQFAWRREAAERTGQDWICLPAALPREGREALAIEERRDGVYCVDRRTRKAEKLVKPDVGGWGVTCGVSSVHPPETADTRAKVDAAVGAIELFDEKEFVRSGRADLARMLLKEFGREKWPICHIASPLWGTYSLWGFENMMLMVAADAGLVRYACDRYLASTLCQVRVAAALGAKGVWIEECMTDMVSPRAFRELNVPLIQCICEEIRKHGMKSIYYYCGDPGDRWNEIFDCGADALSLEESKKGWTVDIDEVVRRAAGRTVVLGNLDAINLLPKASEAELAAEIGRQVAAGRRNRGRFIMSIGSPVTPGTPVSRVRRYCDLTHEIGREKA